MVGVISHIYYTRYKQSTLYMKTLLPPHCLPLEHTASCTMKVKIAIRRSQSLEAIPPTMLKVNVLKMGSNPCLTENQKVVQLCKHWPLSTNIIELVQDKKV